MSIGDGGTDSRVDAGHRPTCPPDTGVGSTAGRFLCHGNVIRWMVTKTLGCDPRQWSRIDIANASVTILAVRPDGSTRLVLFSDVGHLPVEQQTWTGRGAGWAKPAAPGTMR